MVTRVGQALGEGDARRARTASWVGLGLSLAFAVASAAFIALFRHQIAAAYTTDAAVRATCATLLLFAALFQLSDATQVAAACAIRGYKVTRQPMLIQLLAAPAAPASRPGAILGLLLLTAFVLWVASFAVRRMQITYGAEA